MTNQTPKPDDRSDNVEKLQSMIHDTIENMEDAEAAISNSSPEDQTRIAAKNERRRESIDAFRAEIKDEAQNLK